MNTNEAIICVRIDISMERYYHLVEEVIYYRLLPISIHFKWIWYFEYLAALVKVRHPKRKVTLFMGNIEYISREDYIDKKRNDLLRAKRGHLSKLLNEPINDDLFGLTRAEREKKITTLKDAIEALENGEVNFYVPAEYKNTVKQWI